MATSITCFCVLSDIWLTSTWNGWIFVQRIERLKSLDMNAICYTKIIVVKIVIDILILRQKMIRRAWWNSGFALLTKYISVWSLAVSIYFWISLHKTFNNILVKLWLTSSLNIYYRIISLFYIYRLQFISSFPLRY